jgi:N6-L-threonylcarbamoyladenine synthase
LKTAILYFVQQHTARDPGFIQENLSDICASIQHRVVSIVLNKLEKAAFQTGITRLCIAGGVSANSGLRAGLTALGEKHGWQTFIPKFEYCTDNAAMIAITGYHKHLAGDADPFTVKVTARAEW